MTKRILAALLCLFFLAGCSGGETAYTPTGNGLTYDDGIVPSPTEEEKEEKELELVYYPDITLNPYTCTDFTNRALFSLLYQGLFTTDRNYNVFPVLCKSYRVSDDLRSYTIYLEAASFSDGTPVTPTDVVESYRAARENPVYKGRFTHIKTVEALADGGILFTLDTDYENLPILLDIPIVKASQVAEDRPIGSGPYMLNSSTSGTRLLKNSNWWCDAKLPVSATAIPLTEAESTTQIRDAFEFSGVGLVCANPGSDRFADFRCDYELWESENGMFLYMGLNAEAGLFQDTQLRKAVTWAIDRDNLAEYHYRGFARGASLPASPSSPWYSTQLAGKYDYDPEAFANAVAEAGATGKTVRLLVNGGDSLRCRVARSIGEMLKAGGLQVEIIEKTGQDYMYLLNVREYDIYLGQTKLSPNMDLSTFFSRTGSLSYGSMSDTGAYNMCLEALANSGNYYNLHQTVMESGKLCPILFQSYSIYATRGLLSDLAPARDQIFFYTTGNTLADALIASE